MTMTAPDGIDLNTVVEPPESSGTYIHVSIIGADGVTQTASCHIDGIAEDEAVAEAVVRAALAAAHMHSSGSYWALQRLVQGTPAQAAGPAS